MKKNGVYFNSMIWAGAGLSIAEILAGTSFAPLGMKKGILAIILGHIIGGALMFLVGLIGARSAKDAMKSTSMSFGSGGAKFFALLNMLQLLGWTGIMIYDASLSANKLFPYGRSIWALIIGALVIVWLLVKGNELGILNTIAIIALFILCVLLCVKVFNFESVNAVDYKAESTISFASALELSIAMPLSWLPLISDYTHNADKPFRVTLFSVIVYNIISILMYIIGMGLSTYTLESDIANILFKIGGWVGIAGLYVIVLSTVTTTYLDAYSLGISSTSIYDSKKEKWVSVIGTALATIAAVVFNMDNITGFLYLIGGVFAPMASVQIADYFILKNKNITLGVNWRNFLAWFLGFWVYRLMLRYESYVASTIPGVVVTILAVVVFQKIDEVVKKRKSGNEQPS